MKSNLRMHYHTFIKYCADDHLYRNPNASLAIFTQVVRILMKCHIRMTISNAILFFSPKTHNKLGHPYRKTIFKRILLVGFGIQVELWNPEHCELIKFELIRHKIYIV